MTTPAQKLLRRVGLLQVMTLPTPMGTPALTLGRQGGSA